MTPEETFALRVREKATASKLLQNELVDMAATYAQRGYGSLTDEQIASQGITAYQVGLFITGVLQTEELNNNRPATSGPYEDNLSAIRNDFG